jgi:pimeloyl-ACP methyl ester carboxylesterase
LRNYTADRLGDDVLAVIGALHIVKPVLIGHSIAGEELSSVASRHPEAVSSLIYLDAGFPYAYYDPKVGDFTLDLLDLQREASALLPGGADAAPSQTIADLQALLPTLQRDLAERGEMLSYMPSPPPLAGGNAVAAKLTPSDAITLGEQKYTHIPSATLAIFAVPHDLQSMMPGDAKAVASAEAADEKHMSSIVSSFARGVPEAHVVSLRHASHYIFLSNEADVVREINGFLALHP